MDATSNIDGITQEAAAESPAQTVNGVQFGFHFKTTKITDGEGKEIGTNPPHPAFKAVIPVPTDEEIMGYIASADEVGEDKKPTVAARVGKMIKEAIFNDIFLAAKAQVKAWLDAQPAGAKFDPTNFDLSKLTLESIATQPRGRRGLWAPEESDFLEFNTLYQTIMELESGVEKKRIVLHMDLFSKGFLKIKNDKNALAKMSDYLTLFTSKMTSEDRLEQLENVSDTYEWLVARLKKYQEADEKNYAEAL